MNCDELSFGFGKNSKPKKINIDDIRRCPEFKKLKEEEAIEIIDSLYQLSIIALNIYKDEFRSI
jgi:hypothetical protein